VPSKKANPLILKKQVSKGEKERRDDSEQTLKQGLSASVTTNAESPNDITIDSSPTSVRSPTPQNTTTSKILNGTTDLSSPSSGTATKELIKPTDHVEQDFFSDMQPVYKAPKKIEFIEKSNRLKLEHNGDVDAVEDSGWDVQNEELEPSSETVADKRKDDKRERRERKKPTQKKEMKPKLQAVKVESGFEDLEDQE